MPSKPKPIKPPLTKDSRSDTIIKFSCHAPAYYFLATEVVPKKCWDEIRSNGPLPCSGGGVPGEWCMRCRFGKFKEVQEL